MDAILRTLASIVPFLPQKALSSLPSKIAASLVNLPPTTHSKAINLICDYLLPLLLGKLLWQFILQPGSCFCVFVSIIMVSVAVVSVLELATKSCEFEPRSCHL